MEKIFWNIATFEVDRFENHQMLYSDFQISAFIEKVSL